MSNFITTLESTFKENSNAIIAPQQKAYMKNQFEFCGMITPVRRAVSAPFLVQTYLPEKQQLHKIVRNLWLKPEREYQYFAQEFAFKYHKQFEEKDIELFEFMVLYKSWWDTIDFIAPKLMGNYFKLYPYQRNDCIEKWLASDNIWLQRSCILFQLKYKDKVDTAFLSYVINSLLGSKEFFINKAIGWVLREYSKQNPQWVIAFADKTRLSNLSRKEALRLL